MWEASCGHREGLGTLHYRFQVIWAELFVKKRSEADLHAYYCRIIGVLHCGSTIRGAKGGWGGGDKKKINVRTKLLCSEVLIFNPKKEEREEKKKKKKEKRTSKRNQHTGVL